MKNPNAPGAAQSGRNASKMNPGASRKAQNTLAILAFGYWGLYFIASWLPSSPLWGVHHLAFVPPIARMLSLAGTMILLIPAVNSIVISFFERSLNTLSTRKLWKLLVIISAIAGAGCVLWQGTIATDMYGDSRTILQRLAGRTYTIGDLGNLAETEPLSLLLHQSLSRLTGMSPQESYRIVSVGSGVIFLLFLILFLGRIQSSMLSRITMAIALMSLGAHQLFFGHVENYTIVFLLMILTMMVGWHFFRKPSWRTVSLLMILFVLGVRIHIEMVLLVPALLYVLAYKLSVVHPFAKRLIQPRALLFIAGASLFLGVILYIFVFQAYDATGASQEDLARRIFLPVVNPLPAPHDYSLLSWKHCSDVIQQILLSTSPITVVMLVGAIPLRRILRFNEPRVVFYLLASAFVLVFVGTVNPILSMPRDWDFLAIAGAPPAFLALAVYAPLYARSDRVDLGLTLSGSGFALSIFAGALFFVNSQGEFADARLRNMGIWVYKSYYRGASYVIQSGTRSILDTKDQIQERIRILSEIMPYKSPADYEVGFLYEKLGELYFIDGDDGRAVAALQEAASNHGMTTGGLKLLALAHFGQVDLPRATLAITRYIGDTTADGSPDPEGFLLKEEIERAGNLLKEGVPVDNVRSMVHKRMQSVRNVLARNKIGPQ